MLTKLHKLLTASALSVLAATPPASGAVIRFIEEPASGTYQSTTTQNATPQSHLCPLLEGTRVDQMRVKTHGSRIVGKAELPTWNDSPTSIDGSTYSGKRPFLELEKQPIIIAGEITVGGSRYAEIVASKQWQDSLGQIHEIDSATLFFESDTISDESLVSHALLGGLALSEVRKGQNRISSASTPEYLIITSRELAASFEPLRQYRTGLGVTTSVKDINEILAQYPGRDNAERLRNFLISFHADGGRYVLLGGDASIIPVRYAYPYPTDSSISLRDQLLCDLYYADLTGNWDVDSDNVWGERYQDQPDAVPELMIGRLPVGTTDEIARYTAKLIRYETNPGDGDPMYLARTLFYSADQMRDYGIGGQHGVIASAFPPGVTIDTVAGVEAPSGSAANPTNTGPLDLPSAIRSGYGIVNIIAHGRFDGFVFRSSGYNGNPKQYLLTGGFSEVQCAFDSVGQESSPSFYYSLACDNAGFDLDRPPFMDNGIGMSRALLGSSRGAVAMVGNTRWGWIGSSYLLQKAFFDSLFAHSSEPAIFAMYRSQQTYWYYRDLVFGQAFLGDPLVRVYTSIPRRLTVDASASDGNCVATVWSSSGREGGIDMTLSDSGGIIETRLSSPDGSVTFTTPLEAGHSYLVTASGTGTTTGFAALTGSLILGVDNEQATIPRSFALRQNYPNPFNPTTTIHFDLPKLTAVTLSILNVIGQEIARPLDMRLPSGTHVVEWNGHDNRGREVASGIYFFRLACDEFTATRKMVLVR